jgi:fumarate hydratase class II
MNRIEKDTLGEIAVPSDKYWGAQTQRSLDLFKIGNHPMPGEVIKSYSIVKRAAAQANAHLGVLEKGKADLISQVCNEISEGQLDEHFPLPVWQTGSGTHTNMNVNEVIANRAKVIKGMNITDNPGPLHPNDDVNKSQSTNDTFPTAMHVAAYRIISNSTIPGLNNLYVTLKDKSEAFKNIIKTGRTHCMDAVPLTLGQEFSGYAAQIEQGIDQLQKVMALLLELPVGGTAVGTGLNTPKGFSEYVVHAIAQETGFNFKPAGNKFKSIASHDEMIAVSSALKNLACSMMKISNDLRILASGPRCGIGEINIPANEPGSSIMPGKVNPTQIEAATMVCAQIIGNDQAISVSGLHGHLDLNVFKPVMIYNLLESAQLLGDASDSLTEHCIKGITTNQEMINRHLDNSLMLVTSLNTHIGYEKAASIAKKAYQENKTLRNASIELGLLTEEEFDQIVDPQKMI